MNHRVTSSLISGIVEMTDHRNIDYEGRSLTEQPAPHQGTACFPLPRYLIKRLLKLDVRITPLLGGGKKDEL